MINASAGPGWRRGAAVVGAVVVLVACSRSASPSASAPTDGDRRYVAVLARHVRHQGDVAAATAVRLAAVDPDAGRVASHVAADAARRADELDGLLRTWGVDGPSAAALFAGAVGLGSVPPGTVVYGCSLAGPLDDLSQVQQIDPARLARRFAQVTLTSAVEGRALVATAGGGHDAAARRSGEALDTWERELLRRIAPMLPITDQAFASAGGEPSSE